MSTSTALGLFSGTSPITYNSGTGAIGISQSGSSTNGYLSSTDWNTFNNKVSTTTAASTYVPYSGATGAVNLGSNNFCTTGTLSAGTSTLSNLAVTNNATSTFAGNICSAGNIVAGAFFGDGSHLTGVGGVWNGQLCGGCVCTGAYMAVGTNAVASSTGAIAMGCRAQ